MPFGEEIAANIGARNVTNNAYGYVDDSNRQQFTGHERDEETGLDYMQARHYGSALGRFVSVDTVGGRGTDPQTLNLYAYVNNNPLRYVDPTGHALADIQEAEAEYDKRVSNTQDALRAQKYLNEGNIKAAQAIFDSNPDVGIMDGSKELYGQEASKRVGERAKEQSEETDDSEYAHGQRNVALASRGSDENAFLARANQSASSSIRLWRKSVLGKAELNG